MNRAFDWKFWAGLVISAAFLYLALRLVDLPTLWQTMSSAALPALFFAVVLAMLQYPARAVRWSILISPLKNASLGKLLLATLVGFAGNCLLPARLGELIRANYLGVSEGMSRSSVFGTIVVERLFDAFTLLAVLWAGLFLTEFSPGHETLKGAMSATGLFLFSAYAVLILALAGFKWKSETCLKVLHRALFMFSDRFRERVTEIAWKFSQGIVLIKGSRRWLWAVLASILVWLPSLLQILAVSFALGIKIPFSAPLIILAFASLGAMIPSSPGFIGTYHLAVQYGFMVHGFTPEEGLSAAILIHASFFIPTVLAGVMAFISFHIPWEKIAHSGHEAE